MGMMAFHLFFPDEAADECRTVVPVGISDLPRRTFVFMEAYCADPRCDCRRVMLNVVDAETHDQVATINYAFEPPQPPVDDEGQMFLDPLNPQTAMSPAFLQLTADMMARDRAYHDRLVRHYAMWKRVVDDPFASRPGQTPSRAGQGTLPLAQPDAPLRAEGWPQRSVSLRKRSQVQEVLSSVSTIMSRATGHNWQFKARFRRRTFGWRSQPAITRVREAVSEIRQVVRRDPVEAADGAIGTAVNHAIAELVPIIAGAPVDATTKAAWLERLFDAHSADQIPLHRTTRCLLG